MELSSGICKAGLPEPTTTTLEADVRAITASRSDIHPLPHMHPHDLPTSAISKRLALSKFTDTCDEADLWSNELWQDGPHPFTSSS